MKKYILILVFTMLTSIVYNQTSFNTPATDNYIIANSNIRFSNAPIITVRCSNINGEQIEDSVFKVFDRTNKIITLYFKTPINNTQYIYAFVNIYRDGKIPMTLDSLPKYINIKSFKLLSAISNNFIPKTLSYKDKGKWNYTNTDYVNLICGVQIEFDNGTRYDISKTEIVINLSTSSDTIASYNDGYAKGVAECTSTSTQKINNEGKNKIYPNPVNVGDNINVEYDRLKMVYIYDLTGKIVKTTTEKVVSTVGIKVGTYILKIIYDGNKTDTKKIVVLN